MSVRLFERIESGIQRRMDCVSHALPPVATLAQVPHQTGEEETTCGGMTAKANRVQHNAAQGGQRKFGGTHN